MRLETYNYVEDTFECARPTIGIFCMHFNSKSDEKLAKYNKWRARIGFSEVLDDGRYVQLELWLGTRTIGATLHFRERRLKST